MFDFISNTWDSSFWGKVYVVFGLITIAFCVTFVIVNIVNNPRKKLAFVEKAIKDGTSVISKLTCLTVHGTNKPEYYEAEYMYFVDGQRYFVTYKLGCETPNDFSPAYMNADMLLNSIKCALLLFYDKNNPKKVMSKVEIFSSSDAICQIHTAKKNIHRNIEKDWDIPIDLIMRTY